MALARDNPVLKINSCSPGFIETDLTRSFATKMGKTPAEMRMTPVEAGAVAPLFLMTAKLPTPAGESWYWGSDAQRSPLDKYRSPGDPPFVGGASVEPAKEFGILR